MATEPLPTEPTLPFLRINDYHVIQFSLETDSRHYRACFPKMQNRYFEAGNFKENTYILDVNCWKFPIVDVVNLGRSWSILGILFGGDFRPKYREVRVKYIYGPPIHLTFDEARKEVVELICRKIWFSKTQDRESQKSFRARMAKCENMRDLIVGRRDPDPKGTYIGGISFYGEWVG
jgi:hypothetical protein